MLSHDDSASGSHEAQHNDPVPMDCSGEQSPPIRNQCLESSEGSLDESDFSQYQPPCEFQDPMKLVICERFLASGPSSVISSSVYDEKVDGEVMGTFTFSI